MPATQEIKDELDELTTLKFISQAFTEASAASIKMIRDKFETNKEFYDEISHIFHLVRIAYDKYKKEKKIKNDENKQERVLSVALTSNHRFYGNINVNIMRKFMTDVEQNRSEVMIIGTTGKDFMKSSGFSRKFDTLIFAKDQLTIDEMKDFLEKIKPFHKVFLYYPQFVSLLTQTVGITDITQVAQFGEKNADEKIEILFEPEVPKILEFFEQQVRSLLFLHVLLEADLSRTAARLISMNAAEERADEIIKEQKAILRKINSSVANRRLLETFSGMSVWKKKKH
jgi:ATP synthase F1 gamma subunit